MMLEDCKKLQKKLILNFIVVRVSHQSNKYYLLFFVQRTIYNYQQLYYPYDSLPWPLFVIIEALFILGRAIVLNDMLSSLHWTQRVSTNADLINILLVG